LSKKNNTIFIIKESTTLPTGENGAMAVSGSNFFIFL